VTVDIRREFPARIDRLAKMVEPVDRIRACRDPDDDRVLEVAVAGEADYIVTGDRDLLVRSIRSGASAS
jgi:putative PIN family toxin of toxin-antitoxin system